MEAKFEIAGLDEIIKGEVYKAVKRAAEDIVRPLLKEFKAEMIAVEYEELLKKPTWNKKDIMAYTGYKSGWIYKASKKYSDFPEKLNLTERTAAVWDRDEMIKFFARHPEIPTTAKKDLKMIRRKNEINN